MLALLLLVLLAGAQPLLASPLTFDEPPTLVLREVPYSVTVKNAGHQEQQVKWVSKQTHSDKQSSGSFELKAGETKDLAFKTEPDAGNWVVQLTDSSGDQVEATGRALPGWVSLIPPLVAIGLALATKQVLVALILGIFSGAWLWKGHAFAAFCTTLDTFLVESITNKDHAFILLFTMALGGMVSLVSASGGMQGMVDKMSRAAKTPASTQIVTWLMGVAIFFDDYANTLLVGQTMKPVTDKQKISREKLAYLVDSTAAPIASIALISTWIGYEMSLIEDGFKALSIDRNVYQVFLQSIVHRYYAIFTLAFVFAIAYFHRDFGPMLKAERRALTESPSDDPDPKSKALEEEANQVTWGRSAWDAIIPVGVVLFGTIAGLVYTGREALADSVSADFSIRYLGDLISAGNSFEALLWAAASGGIISAVMTKVRYRISVEQITEVYVKGVTHMMGACIVLVLAWAIGDVCGKLYTGPYLVELTTGRLSAELLPTVTFLLSAAVAFSTGTSWGTMAIVMPLAIRLSVELPKQQGLDASMVEIILISTIAGVLAGSTFGDHCSPISDTTIMSSLASGCDHIAHVSTQIPYALVTAFLAIVFGSIPAAYGVNPWLLNIVGIALCFIVVRFVGKPVYEVKNHD
jgi:Na+/H+ antiporter NhaC